MSKDKKYIKKDEQSTAEQAINKKKTEGKKINHQVEQRREKHEPRDDT